MSDSRRPDHPATTRFPFPLLVRRTFLCLAPLPLILWTLGLRYLARLDGWGAAGTAAVVLVPALALSAALALWGLALLWRAWRRGEAIGLLALGTSVSGIVAVYYGFRGVA